MASPYQIVLIQCVLTVKQGFYDPVKDSFIEPKNTGISYSFTADGHFEEAYYRAVANRTSPQSIR